MNMTLSDKFHQLYSRLEEDPHIAAEIVNLIENSPESYERAGLQALMYHEGIGYPADLEKSFESAEKAADGEDPLGYFMLGYMCDNAETPDQATGGARQKYDHYDAEHFYELCARRESRWKDPALFWLGDYYLDSAAGGDPDIGVEYLESITDHYVDAAARLSDYFWNLVMPEYFEDDEWRSKLFKWTEIAARLDPEQYAYRLGWLYADGIGCEESAGKAVEYFIEAHEYGDRRGAKAAAKVLEEYVERNPDLSSDELMDFREEIDRLNKLSDEPYQEQLQNDRHPSNEED